MKNMISDILPHGTKELCNHGINNRLFEDKQGNLYATRTESWRDANSGRIIFDWVKVSIPSKLKN